LYLSLVSTALKWPKKTTTDNLVDNGSSFAIPLSGDISYYAMLCLTAALLGGL